jgi:hypothetical protein
LRIKLKENILIWFLSNLNLKLKVILSFHMGNQTLILKKIPQMIVEKKRIK